MLCNGEVVYQKVSIGNIQNLSKGIHETSLLKNIKSFLLSIKNLKYKAIKLQTEKSQSIQAVASGIFILEDYTFLNP